MQLKNYLATLPEDVTIKGQQGLIGAQLTVLTDHFDKFVEFQGKTVEIVKNIYMVGSPDIDYTAAGVEFKQATEPALITVQDFTCLQQHVKLYALILNNDQVFIRCTADSVQSDLVQSASTQTEPATMYTAQDMMAFASAWPSHCSNYTPQELLTRYIKKMYPYREPTWTEKQAIATEFMQTGDSKLAYKKIIDFDPTAQ